MSANHAVAPGYLAADSSLRGAPIEAPRGARRAVRGGAPPSEVAVVLAWNRYGGLLEELARRLAIDPACAVAVLCVESGGQAFGPDGRVTIRFESHIFRRFLDQSRLREFDRSFRIGGPQPWLGHTFRPTPRSPWTAFHGSQALEWRAFEVAAAIDEDAATRSISMGLAQVMGFNHALVGYPNPGTMLAAMGDVRYQVLAMFDFIGGPRGDRPAVVALRRGDLEGFASLYNGPGQARHYAELIAAHVAPFGRLRPAVESSDVSVAAEVTRTGYAYVVKRGDTLSAIARRAGTTVAALARANDIERVDLIFAGQVIVTPRRLG